MSANAIIMIPQRILEDWIRQNVSYEVFPYGTEVIGFAWNIERQCLDVVVSLPSMDERQEYSECLRLPFLSESKPED